MISFLKKFFFVSCYLLGFSFPCFASQESVDDLYKLGLSLSEQREYDGALWELNKAMGMVKRNYNHPLREKIEEAIRVTKAKTVVARYASRRRVSQNSEDGLSPIEDEPNDFMVHQAFGKSLARKIWEDRDSLQSNDEIGIGRTVTVLPDGGIELEENQNRNFSLRCVQAASFNLISDSKLALHSGAYCFYTLRPQGQFTVSSTFVDLQIHSDKPFALMVGVTTNGGMKVIGLLGRFTLIMNEKEEEVLPGELVFCMPKDFSRKMDVELNTLLLTSKLLNSFDKPVVFHKKLNQQALLQALRTKNRYRTTVGDVRGNQNFEMTVFPGE